MLALNCALATGDNNATRSASEATRMMQLGVRRITGPPLIDIGKRFKADKGGSTKGTKEHKGAFDVLRFLFFYPLAPFVSPIPQQRSSSQLFSSRLCSQALLKRFSRPRVL